MWSHLLVLACALLLLPAHLSSFGRRQGESRGARSVGAGARDGRKGQRADCSKRRQAVCPGLRRQDRDRLAGAGSFGAPTTASRPASTWTARGCCTFAAAAIPFSSPQSWPSLRRRWVRRNRQRATQRHRARRELLPLRHPHPGHPRIPARPTAALNSALAVNFNTINAVRKGKTVSSAEPQTPITPLAIEPVPGARP